MKKIIFRPETIILLIILILASFLRFYKYYSFSLSNDELSALCRTHFDNFSDLLNIGVKLDFHPAGVQTFLYFWTQIFGDSEASLRLPFVIAGIMSVLFAYLVASRWFNKVTALFSATSIAFLHLPLLYSQIARPYSSGLLFSLITVYFWTLLIFDSEKRSTRSLVLISLGYSFSTAACMYNHYFSFLFAAIVGISGVFYIRKNKLIYYLGSGIFSVLLFLPHLSVSLYHFSIGGLSSWLGKPDNDWFVQHLRFIFNESFLLFMIFFTIFLFSIIVNQKNIKFTKFHLLSLIWFFLPFLIAFYYSIFFNPVIQNSILIFSFPYLIFFLFSFFDPVINYKKIVLLSAFTIIGIYNTIFVFNYYNKQHFGEFKDLAKTITEWNQQYGEDNITRAINVNAPLYVDYYLDRINDSKVSFEQYENRGGESLTELLEIVKKSKTPYFVYAWTKSAPYEIHDIIKSKYPYLIKRNKYDGLSEVSLYSQIDSDSVIEDPAPFISFYNGFESDNLWGKDNRSLDTNYVKSGTYSFQLDTLMEFGPTLVKTISEISVKTFKRIKITIWALEKELHEAQIVVSIVNKKEGPYYWSSAQLRLFIEEKKWGQVFFTAWMPEIISKDDIIKIYVWNINLKSIYIDDIKIDFYEE